MSKRTGRFSKRAARWQVCCCLCVALPICSVPTLLAPLFVPAHFREFASVATVDAGSMAGWQDFRRVDHVSNSVIHVHEQLKLGRHHHDSTDASIVIVGAAAHNDGSDGVTLSAFAPIALATSDELSFRPLTRSERSERWVRSVRWLAPAACHFQSCDSRRLDRAPIAWPLGPSRIMKGLALWREGPSQVVRPAMSPCWRDPGSAVTGR